MNSGIYGHILLQTFKCKAYLKTVKDGAHIKKTEEDGFYFCKGSTKYDLVNPGDGGEKVYFTRKEHPFTGVVVGVKEVTIRGRLFLGERRDTKGNHLSYFVGKEAIDTAVVALVYYANMRKRWVLIEDIVGSRIDEQIMKELNQEKRKGAPLKESESPYIVVVSDPFFLALSDKDIPF